jgi:hypothetical protein
MLPVNIVILTLIVPLGLSSKNTMFKQALAAVTDSNKIM